MINRLAHVLDFEFVRLEILVGSSTEDIQLKRICNCIKKENTLNQ